MPVVDGLLGRVLETPPTRQRRELTLQIRTAVADRMVAAEVQSRCHNLHGALFLMLDSAGIPSVIVWGSVHAEAVDLRGSFALNAELPAENENHRPGHSWLITPEFSVIDLALAHQGDIGGTYASVKGAIPPIVSISNRNSDPIPMQWYPDHRGSPISDTAYKNATKYFDVLGWSEFSGAGFTVRYLPGAVTVPSEDLQDINLRIGGLRPDDAFEQCVLPLLGGPPEWFGAPRKRVCQWERRGDLLPPSVSPSGCRFHAKQQAIRRPELAD
jgi:hypothetical protein